METIDLSKIKGVVFDLDGVIYDVGPSIKKAVEDGIEKYNIKVDVETVLQEIAHLIEDLQNYPLPQIILNSYDLLKKATFLEGLSYFKKMRIAVFLFNQFNKYKEDATAFEGIDGILSKLSKKVKLAILTNNKSTYAEEILKKFNLYKNFNLIIGFNDVTENKPSPEGILKIMDKWRMKNDNIVFIGDMTSDVLAGKAANVTTIAIATGLAKKESLFENDPDFLIDHPLELKKLFNL
ncbi:MAG: HAD family hydrolase [Promethearchaeota archaeon]